MILGDSTIQHPAGCKDANLHIEQKDPSFVLFGISFIVSELSVLPLRLDPAMIKEPEILTRQLNLLPLLFPFLHNDTLNGTIEWEKKT
jgi:hypothetical protein